MSAEANLKCLGDGKKTISPEFIFAALKEIQMQQYIEELEVAHSSYLEETNVIILNKYLNKKSLSKIPSN